mgnify:CR=1 FL=1
MKFTLLFAAVSAIKIQGPDSGADPTHTYSEKVNNAHSSIMSTSTANVSRIAASNAEQEQEDAWRKVPNPTA